MKRKYSGLTLRDAMQLVERESMLPWTLDVPSRPPSALLTAHLQRLDAFDLESSEPAKALLIDALLAEIVSEYPQLRIWKGVTLETDTLTGMADYIIAPKRAYLATPLLCTVEAKRDDFERGEVQCLAEMFACRWNNRQEGLDTDVFGIVSNGQGWRFYRLTRSHDVHRSELLATSDMPRLLGILDAVCRECADALPVGR